MRNNFPISGTFGLPKNTATAGTAFFQGVPPWCGPKDTAPFIYRADSNNRPNWTGENSAFSHIDRLRFSTTDTNLHTVTIMRPLNWSKIVTPPSQSAKTTLVIADDPGVYSTNYKYPIPGGAGPGVANNVIATNDYIAFQLSDGTWWFTKVSVSTLTLTLTTTIATATGLTGITGGPCFWFGIITDTDPATGVAHPNFLTTSTTNNEELIPAYNDYPAMHPGDPMLVIDSANATTAGLLTALSGFYSKIG